MLMLIFISKDTPLEGHYLAKGYALKTFDTFSHMSPRKVEPTYTLPTKVSTNWLISNTAQWKKQGLN